MDGDRTKELVVSCQIGGGTGVNYEELHVVKKTENGNLMKDGMIHFSFGILAAYMICLLGGGL